MKIFIDANVIVSVLNKEYPLFSYSARLLSLADNPGFQLFTSPVCLAIAFYFAQKKSGEIIAKKKIGLLVEKMHVAIHEKQDIITALANKSIHDFEDGLEILRCVKCWLCLYCNRGYF